MLRQTDTHRKVGYPFRPKIDLLLNLLLISGDLRLFQALVNAEDNFKSSSPVENKRHTNAHQLSPPSQQQRLHPPPSAIAQTPNVYAGSRALLLIFVRFS